MSDGPLPQPDLQSLIRNSMPQKQGPSRILAMFSETVHTTSQLGNPGVLKADGMIQKLPQGRPGVAGGLVDKMFKALQSVPEEVRKMAANVKIEGSLPAGTTVASNAPMVGGGPSGGYEGPSA